MDHKDGKIITFYSYKGGTGRSMALANIAWILASKGKKVLVIDWDLEAPGLHRYFSPFLKDSELQTTDGLIDFLFEYVNASLTKPIEEKDDWYLPYTDINRYTISLSETNFIGKGTLDFVPAGRQDSNYAYKVNSFDWMVFYEKLKGGAFLDIVKVQIKNEYDYVLIDSRTGVSDTSGICTIQMPDSLVACFTYNVQSIDGVSAVISSIVKQRHDNRISVFPVPTRVELGEKDRLDRAREYAKFKLKDFPRIVDREKYWSEVEVLYQPYYAYEEILATFGDKVGQSNSVLAKMEKITEFITIGDVKGVIAPTEDERKSVLDVYLKKYDLAPIAAIETEIAKQPSYELEKQPRYEYRPSISSRSDHIFICYSNADALDFAQKLADNLEGGHPSIKTWVDKRDLLTGGDWDDQLTDAIRGCKAMLFVLTRDSVAEGSNCKQEWSMALKYKKPVIPLRLNKEVEIPFRLSNREWIEFSDSFEIGLARLHKNIAWLDSPQGILQNLKYRLSDAKRDLSRTKNEDQPRIMAEINELNEQIKRQEEIIKNPQAAEERTEKNIQIGLERERQPEKPVAGKTSTRFINPPPGIAPNYFQDRLIETKQIADFLNNDSQRLMTIVGRGGVGKTTMVCRLLKALESGELPDDLGEMKVDGIVYLSETDSHRVNFANIFADLSKFLPPAEETAARLEEIYKNPRTSTGDKMRALLDAFPSGRVILLLDNFETLIDPESLSLRDSELSDALKALLSGQHHAVKVVITTRIAPRDLAISEPGRQHYLILDEGLESPYAENVLREMDADGRVGLKSAPDALLNKAREKTRGYPRALEALYAILSVDRNTTLEELLDNSLPENVVDAFVGEAFNRLEPNDQKVMQALAVYNRPVSPAAVDYLLQPFLPDIDSALLLNRLVNTRLARREAGRYYLHQADREYVFGTIRFAQRDLLLNRAADYFAQARKPRAEWKKLDDLTPQLSEFELRCNAGDYDAAADVLSDIDFDYLLLWGHYRQLIELHLRVKDNITDSNLLVRNLNILGLTHNYTGKVKESIDYYQQGLNTAYEAKNLNWEGVFLRNIGLAYADFGDSRKAIESYQQALTIAREIGDRKGEGNTFSNLGSAYAALGDARKAVEFYQQALIIAREIGDRPGEGNTLGDLGNAYTALGGTRKAIEFYEQVRTATTYVTPGSNEKDCNDMRYTFARSTVVKGSNLFALADHIEPLF